MGKGQEDIHARPKWQQHAKIPVLNVRTTTITEPAYKNQEPYDPQIVSATRVFTVRGNQYRKKQTFYIPTVCLDGEFLPPSDDITTSFLPNQEFSAAGPMFPSIDVITLTENQASTSASMFKTRSHACRSAGLKPIKDCMKTAAMRIIATRSGQPYDTHVDNVAAQEEKLMKQKLKKMEHKMVISRVSSQSVYKPAGEEMELPYMATMSVSIPGSVMQKRGYYLTMRVNATREKVKAIHRILCVLFNMQLKALRSKLPIKRARLKLLYRDPFKVEPWEKIKKPTFMKEKKIAPEIPGFNQDSYLTVKRIPTNYVLSPESAAHVDSLSSRRFIAGVAPSVTRPLEARVSSSSPASSRTDQRSVSRRHRKLRLDDHTPCRLENWEDLLNVGVKNRQLRVSRHRLPPWQTMPKVGSYIVRKADPTSANFAKEARIHIKQRRLDLIQLKIKAQDDTELLLHKIDRQRMVKYEKKLTSLSGKLKKVFAHELEKLDRINKGITTELTHDMGETAKWYIQLEKECEQFGAMADDETLSWLMKLDDFKGDEMLSGIPNLHEKLCLFVMSAPVYDICNPPMQGAIKFVLENILQLTVTPLMDWLQMRSLPYLYIEPEMMDEVEDEPSKMSQYSAPSFLAITSKPTSNVSQLA